MSPHDDHLFETEGGVDGAVDATRGDGGPVGDGSVGDPVTAFLADLRAFADGPAPAPSAELLAAFGGATPLAGRRLPGRRALAVAAAAVVLGATGVAAAQHQLPDPAQRLVSRVVEVLTPFQVDPADRVSPKPTRTVPAVPLPTQEPSESPEAPEPSESGDDHGGSRPGGGSDDGSGSGSGSDDGSGSSGGSDDSGGGTKSSGDDGGSSTSGRESETREPSPTRSSSSSSDGSDGSGSSGSSGSSGGSGGSDDKSGKDGSSDD